MPQVGPTPLDTADLVATNLISRIKVSPLNKMAWMELAHHFKHTPKPDFFRAEICYVAAMYCDPDDIDLTQKWLGVYSFNRHSDSPPDVILSSAQTIERGIREMQKDNDVLLDEIKFCIVTLEDAKMAL